MTIGMEVVDIAVPSQEDQCKTGLDRLQSSKELYYQDIGGALGRQVVVPSVYCLTYQDRAI
jgi:hypothetical protein